MHAACAAWRCGRDYQVIDADGEESVLFLAGNHRVLRISAALGERLKGGIDALSADELREWDELIDAGLICAANELAGGSRSFRDGANLAINVNLTSACNLGCTYCFADGGDYGRIKGRMDSETVDAIFRFLAEHVTPTQTVRFEFFGGEPLLNLERIEEVCRRAGEASNITGLQFIYRISTNLTVLPPRAVELLARNAFIISVSIDGGAETHDRNRPTKNGRGSFCSIVENCRKVRAAGDELVLVARMTVVDGRQRLIDNVRELWQLNLFDYFQIYPGVVPSGKGDAGRLVQLDVGGPASNPETVTPSCGCGPNTIYAGFLEELAEFTARYGEFFSPHNRFRGVLEYERIVDMVLAGKTALSFCSAGRNYFTFSPDDSIMPCHRLVGNLNFQVGDGKCGLSGSGLEVWRSPVDDHPACSQCWVRYICAGGCKQENLVANGRLDVPNREGCDYQRNLVSGVVTAMAEGDDTYRRQPRRILDDLFVSCGRPVVLNHRCEDESILGRTRHFLPLSCSVS